MRVCNKTSFVIYFTTLNCYMLSLYVAYGYNIILYYSRCTAHISSKLQRPLCAYCCHINPAIFNCFHKVPTMGQQLVLLGYNLFHK